MNKNNLLKVSMILVALFSFAGCGKNKNFNRPFSLNDSTNTSQEAPSNPNDSTEEPAEEIQFFKPSICSDLSFENVKWPLNLTDFQINIFALAMNISGSFEGVTGWTNISNNFDGQGISLGLFNQNLGQGSLQPMMMRLRDSSPSKLSAFYSSSQYKSLNSMLIQWGGLPNKNVLTKASAPINLYESDVSSLDEPEAIELEEQNQIDIWGKSITPKNQKSVDWSVKNVYKGSKFKPEWKTALQKMSGSPEYVSIQVAAAQAIHNKALGYMRKFNFKEMRAYFFFFDIVVQNGGITKAIENKYLAWAKLNPKASETVRLKKLLEYRLTIVVLKYRNDVKSRKLSVINGTGLVHGDKRDFQKEYCAPTWATVVPKDSL